MKIAILISILITANEIAHTQVHRDTLRIIEVDHEWAESVNGQLRSFPSKRKEWTFDKHEGYNEIFRKSGKKYMSGSYELDAHKRWVETDTFKFYNEEEILTDIGSFNKGKKSGLWKHFNDKGVLTSSGEYQQDLKVGLWKYFTDQGIPDYEEQRDSLIRTYYYPSGKVKATGGIDSTGRDLQGYWKYYFEKTGDCECEGTFVRSLKHNTWKYYKKDGSLEEEIFHKLYSADYRYKPYEACKWK